jgi:protein ImuB
VARIACLWVPDLALAALVRTRPELGDAAVAIAEGRAPQSVLRAVSPRGRAAGVRLGMTAAQARAVDDAIVVVPHEPETLRAAAETLADVAATFGPRVEVAGDGTVFLDCEGSAALCASEHELATVLAARAAHHGLAAQVGVGGSKLAARIAAREGGGVHVVAPAEEAAFLEPLPIALLEPAPKTAEALASWGIDRIGQLAALPAGAAAHRLGPDGARLVRQAHGQVGGTDDALLAPRAAPGTIVEAMALESGVDRLEPLLFVVRRLLDQTTGRLALRGLACAELAVTLELDGGATLTRRITPGAPTTETKVLFVLVRAHLEQHPPGAAIVGLRLAALTTRPRPTQLDLYRPNGPSAVALATTLARLAALCGPERVGRPLRVDSYRPDATAVAAFTAPPPANGTSDGAAIQLVSPRVALRAFRPPAHLEVFESGGRLAYVRGRGFGGRVVRLAGPWRVCGEWWTSDPYDREYYDVELTDGGLYRIYREAMREAVREGGDDGGKRRWLADGMYD